MGTERAFNLYSPDPMPLEGGGSGIDTRPKQTRHSLEYDYSTKCMANRREGTTTQLSVSDSVRQRRAGKVWFWMSSPDRTEQLNFPPSSWC